VIFGLQKHFSMAEIVFGNYQTSNEDEPIQAFVFKMRRYL